MNKVEACVHYFIIGFDNIGTCKFCRLEKVFESKKEKIDLLSPKELKRLDFLSKSIKNSNIQTRKCKVCETILSMYNEDDLYCYNHQQEDTAICVVCKRGFTVKLTIPNVCDSIECLKKYFSGKHRR